MLLGFSFSKTSHLSGLILVSKVLPGAAMPTTTIQQKRFGNEMVKQLPLCGSLSTLMLPPWASTMP